MSETTMSAPGGPTMSRRLVETPQGPDAYTGLGFIESLHTVGVDAFGGGSPSALFVDAPVAALDVLSALLDPLGELVKAGVGWLLEHVSILRESLEAVTGNANAVAAIAQTWENVAQALSDCAKDFQGAVKSGLGSWHGDASRCYRMSTDAYANHLGGLANRAHDTSVALSIAGGVVAAERGIIFDLISSFISRILTEALIAAASAAFTIGGSLAAFAASVTADAAILAGRLGKRLAKLVTLMKKFTKQVNLLGSKSAVAANKLGDLSQKLSNSAEKTIRTQTKIKKGLNDNPIEDWRRDWKRSVSEKIPVAEPLSDSKAVTTAKEGAKGLNQDRDILTHGDYPTPPAGPAIPQLSSQDGP